MISSKQFRHCIIYLAIIIAFIGCFGGPSRERVKEKPEEDIKIEMSIKSKLLQEDDLNAASIHVEAKGGVIQLSGFVETESQRQRATTVARRVPGVHQVHNRIEVK
jgi:osmotically-inducible protein OsmY